jgi:hypothetical protein
MYKVLNRMGPKSLTNLFSYKSEKTNYNLRDISSGLSLPKPRVLLTICMTEHTFGFGIIFQRKLGKANSFFLSK